MGCVYEKGGQNFQEFGPVILASGEERVAALFIEFSWNSHGILFEFSNAFLLRRLRRRLHKQLAAGPVQTRFVAPAHHQRRALHRRRHQDGSASGLTDCMSMT